MNTKQHDENYRALNQILRHYNWAGFVVKTIHCDGEYRGIMEKVGNDLDVNMNLTNAQDHVPEAEWNNQMIKEWIWATYYCLPYKEIPRIMIHYLAMIQTNQLNFLSVKGGVSSYYSPHMILSPANLDYTKHFVVPFGAYVQANHESVKTASNVTRTLDAIYLRPAQNQQGGHELMDLNGGQLITRNIIHEITVTNVVIKAVENMAYKQGFKSLNFKNRNGVIYHNADWIAGVDYDDIKTDEDNEEQYSVHTEEDKTKDQLEQYKQIDGIIQDARQNINPNVHEENDNADEQHLDHPEEPHETAEDKESQAKTEPTRRSTQEARPIEGLGPQTSGKPYMQQKKKVIFKSDRRGCALRELS
jgi:hypothetical protein